MKRLTKCVDGITVLESWAIDKDPVSIIQRLCNRLAAYEDTGLEPEDIISSADMAKIACALHELNTYKDLGPIDHLRDLLRAEKDGIPKGGTKVFVLTTVGYWPKKYAKPEIIECFVTTHRLAKNGETKFSVDGYWDSGSYYKAVFGKTSMGKTVFLTREEAEAALKGGEG